MRIQDELRTEYLCVSVLVLYTVADLPFGCVPHSRAQYRYAHCPTQPSIKYSRSTPWRACWREVQTTPTPSKGLTFSGRSASWMKCFAELVTTSFTSANCNSRRHSWATLMLATLPVAQEHRYSKGRARLWLTRRNPGRGMGYGG